MEAHRRLAAVSAAQSTLGIAGLAVALRRRHAFDVPFMHGDPERMIQQSIYFGTSLSAPAIFLVAQTVATIRLTRGPDPAATRLLQALGLVYVGGYLAERRVRRCLTRRRWDPVESPLLVAAIALSVAMGKLGRRGDGPSHG
jgi:hypothetical protein